MQYLKDLAVKELAPGYDARLIHGAQSTLSIVDIKAGSVLREHFHPHEQITYVVEGEFEMKIGGVDYLFTAGTVHVIPSNTPHSAYARTNCKVIDAFSPARDDYR